MLESVQIADADAAAAALSALGSPHKPLSKWVKPERRNKRKRESEGVCERERKDCHVDGATMRGVI